MRSAQRGFTIIELVISIAVLAIALTGITLMLSGGLSRSADTMQEVRAVALGQAYLDEILGKRFDENTRDSGVPPCRNSLLSPRPCSSTLGPESGESRATYDDVDDYHGLDEGLGAADTTLRDPLGNARIGFDNFRVSVSVRYSRPEAGGEEFGLGVGDELDDAQDAKLIEVTVSHRSVNPGIVFSAYKSNF
ncbi:MAG: type II secretion system protein [Gammaproteobacteria bacterium]|nr:type II secretion system protein [Gammaproteobacteria bacterium]